VPPRIPCDLVVGSASNPARAGCDPRIESMAGTNRERRDVPNKDIAVPLTGVAGAALLVWGWLARDEFYVNAAFGPGYALGVVGLAMMLVLLGYSLRKRMRALGTAGPIRHWFTIHMMLGLLGPVAILFHANFQLGSLNSNVALVCMLLVAGSGIVGRLIYPRIHHGMAGQRATLHELRDAARTQRATLTPGSELEDELNAFERTAISGGGTLQAFGNLVQLSPRARRLSRAAQARLDPEGRRALTEYVAAARRAAGFRLYERLFAWWHAFHMPLCVMLFAAAAFHVLAVHMY
jgi:hypothetical protein